VRRAIRKHLRDFAGIVALILLALGIGGYIVSQQRLRLPFIDKPPFRVKVELPNAQAVVPGQGQTVRVAGVRIGDIGKVELKDGHAVVELELDPEQKGLIRQDATALLRTKTGLKDMFLEVDPGDGKPLESGGQIRIANTAPDTNPDEILSALDSDTRDYLKLLISGAGKGLKGRGSDLRETLRRFGPLHRDLARVSEAVARRRGDLRQLVNRYGLLMSELGGKDRQITRLVQASNAVFGSFASQNHNLSSFVAKLPGSLGATHDALVKVNGLGRQLGPALDALRPPFRHLAGANRAVLPFARQAAPILRDQIRPFARIAAPYTKDLGLGARDLAKAGPDLSKSFHGLNRLFNMGAFNKNGAEGLTGNLAKDRARDEGYLYWLAWAAQNSVSLFSTSDAQGPFRRIYAGGVSCASFTNSGLPAAVAGALGDAGVCSK
jgi:phospholipid/cholesterol/gamma-HCH transport system substrate-binding protein